MDAVAAARSGDTILVAPCTYYGSVDFLGKSLRIVSTDGPAATTILASPGHPVVSVRTGEGPGTVLEGFTLMGGGSPTEPVVEEEFASLTLRDVVLTENSGTVLVYARSSLIVLDRVTIDDTNLASEGLIIQGRRGSSVIRDSEISCGTAAFGYTQEHGFSFIEGTTFHCAGATAAWLFHGPARLQRDMFEGRVFVENENSSAEATVVEGSLLLGGLDAYGAAIDLRNVVSTAPIQVEYSALSVRGSIVTTGACGISGRASSTSVSYSDFYGNTTNGCGVANPVGLNGNFSEDPLFVDVAAGDYHLQAGSLCVDAGPPDTSELDPDATPNDVGAYGGPFSLGGGR